MATAGACGKASTSQKVFVVHMFSDMTLAVNALAFIHFVRQSCLAAHV